MRYIMDMCVRLLSNLGLPWYSALYKKCSNLVKTKLAALATCTSTSMDYKTESAGKLPNSKINKLRPGQDGRPFADDIFNSIVFNEKYGVQLNVRWNIFLTAQLSSQHLLRKQFGADQATSHYLNRWWLCSLAKHCVFPPCLWNIQTRQICLGPFHYQ